MVENLKEICILLTNQILKHNSLALKNENIANTCRNLIKKDDLPEQLNIDHLLETQMTRYIIRNCPEFHCFECLARRIKIGKEDCQHGKILSKYEMEHVVFLWNELGYNK